MKRGFLLSDAPIIYHINSTQSLPQSKLEETTDPSKPKPATQSKERVIATSGALLDLEGLKEKRLDGGDNDESLRQHHSPPAVSPLLSIIESNINDSKGGNFGHENNFILDNCDEISGLGVRSSSTPPTKSRKPLIIELEQSSSRDVENSDDGLDLGESNAAASATERTEFVVGSLLKSRLHSDPPPKLPNETGSTNSITPSKDLLDFSNDVSLLLARLRKSTKSRESYGEETWDKHPAGVESFVSKRSALLIKSFVGKHFNNKSKSESLRCIHYLGNLWGMTLDKIAQDHVNMKLRSAKKSSSKTSISPHLAVCLGVLEFADPFVTVHESVAGVLFGAHRKESPHDGIMTKHSKPHVREDCSKQHRILALGAIHLVRCRICSISFAVSQLESRTELPITEQSENSTERVLELKNIDSELVGLLVKVLPALENIVSTSTSGFRTVVMMAAADACFELLEMASRVVVLQYMLEVSGSQSGDNFKLWSGQISVWRDVLPSIEKLLGIKQCWISRPEKQKNGFSRMKCAMAVLDDWLDVVKESKHLFFDHFVGDACQDGGSDIRSGLNLFWNLSGISLTVKGDGMTSGAIIRVGGIAQSLCQNRDCIIHGPISFPHHNVGGDEAQDIVSFLHKASTSTEGVRSDIKTLRMSEAWAKMIEQRAAIRAFAAWLSRGNKASRILMENTKRMPGNGIDLLDSAMNSLLVLLRSGSAQSVDMSIAALSTVWSISPGWAPQDHDSDEIARPQSFLELLDALQIHSAHVSSDEDISTIDSTSRALCAVVARIALRKPKVLLPHILKMGGRVEVMIEVMLNMLEEIPHKPSSNDENDGGRSNYDLYRAASRILLQYIETVPHLRSRISSNPLLFSKVPCEIIIPQILDNLVRHDVGKKSLESTSLLSGLLCNIMEAKTNSGDANGFVQCVIVFFKARTTTQIANFFNKQGPLWRSALLKKSISSDSAYKDIMLATANSMIELPSSSTPLALLASLSDSQFHPELSQSANKHMTEKRIFIATLDIITFVLDQIPLSRKNDIVTEETIFGRLAPLLILRRIPSSYYTAVHKALPREEKTMEVMADLANFLSSSLKSCAKMKNSQSNLVREEKKLLAELAGHCLPLSSNINNAKRRHPSLFESICREPLSNALVALRGNCFDEIHSIHEAKTSIYAISHSVPLLADDSDEGAVLLNVASFVFEVLKYEPGHVEEKEGPSQQFQKETMMLQSGCVHFLAVILDSLSYRMTNSTNERKPHPLIEDVDDTGALNASKTRKGLSILDAISSIFRTVKAIIMTGEVLWKTLYHDMYSFRIEGMVTVVQFPPSSRIAMLNSIVMLSQGSKAKGRLDWIVANTIPPLVFWVSKFDMVDNAHHQLCIAAALQVIYTALARCGSFDWLLKYPVNLSENDFVCLTLRCALKNFHVNDGNGTKKELRLAAMKVVLAVTALIQASELESEQFLKGYLSTAEVHLAMSALHGAANVDQDPLIRQLANQIIPFLT